MRFFKNVFAILALTQLNIYTAPSYTWQTSQHNNKISRVSEIVPFQLQVKRIYLKLFGKTIRVNLSVLLA
jgi:hypothetical protein